MLLSIHRYANETLTNLENHRTQTEHNDAKILKSAIFSFVNTYVSFFYIAFVAGNQITSLFGYPKVLLSIISLILSAF